jgi:hypothetical protein
MHQRLSSDGDLNLNSGLERDRGDLLDDLGRRGEVDEALVDAHLEAVPGLGTLTTGRLAGGVLEELGGEADGALDAEVTVLGAVDEVRRDWRKKSATVQMQGSLHATEDKKWKTVVVLYTVSTSTSISCPCDVLLTLLEVLHVARGEGDADLVHLGGGASLLEVLLGSHF